MKPVYVLESASLLADREAEEKAHRKFCEWEGQILARSLFQARVIKRMLPAIYNRRDPSGYDLQWMAWGGNL